MHLDRRDLKLGPIALGRSSMRRSIFLLQEDTRGARLICEKDRHGARIERMLDSLWDSPCFRLLSRPKPIDRALQSQGQIGLTCGFDRFFDGVRAEAGAGAAGSVEVGGSAAIGGDAFRQ